jgi:RNA polymerase sigma-70 factor (ECF subfamily)
VCIANDEAPPDLTSLGGAGDFDEFWRLERARFVALAAALTGDWAAAEDLVQDAFLAAHRRWSTIDNPTAWMRRVISNRAVSRWRRRTREAEAFARLANRREPVMLEPQDTEFWKAVRELPRRQSQVIALHYLDDLSVVEIASVLGIAEGTVKVTLSTGRRALARALQCALDEENER